MCQKYQLEKQQSLIIFIIKCVCIFDLKLNIKTNLKTDNA